MSETEEPTQKRMTTADAARMAQEAMALATAMDEQIVSMSEKITDLSTRVAERAADSTAPELGRSMEIDLNLMASRISTLESISGVTRDQVDGRIHEALEPLHAEVHDLRAQLQGADPGTAKLSNLLARLEAVEHKMAAPQDPPNGGIIADVGDRMEQLARDFADLRQHVETHGTHVTQALVNEVAKQVREQLPDAAVGEFTLDARPLGATRKVLELMRSVTHIGKAKEANLGQGGRFKFRGVDDAMDAVGHAMREVGLALSTSVLARESSQREVQSTDSNGRARTTVWTTTHLTVEYTFVDPEDGSTHPITMVGEGRDSGDKSTSKAASMALKYGLFQALMIPVTGLDDADNDNPQITQEDPAPAASAPPKRTEAEKATRAAEALRAIRNLHLVLGSQGKYDRLVQIMSQVSVEGLLEFEVEGATLGSHGRAAAATLNKSAGEHEDVRSSTEPPVNDEGAGRHY